MILALAAVAGVAWVIGYLYGGRNAWGEGYDYGKQVMHLMCKGSPMTQEKVADLQNAVAIRPKLTIHQGGSKDYDY